jgi:hypothetical protein
MSDKLFPAPTMGRFSSVLPDSATVPAVDNGNETEREIKLAGEKQSRMSLAGNESMKKIVVGLGEVLWDILPERRYLDGAPANLAYIMSLLGSQGYCCQSRRRGSLRPRCHA